MQNAEGLKPDQISEFLKASEGIDFVGQKRAEIYGWIQQVLVAQGVWSPEQEATGQHPGLP